MELTDAIFLIAAGFAAGFINTVAGGGSLITLPLLIFMGLPSADANATNRVALFFQNSFAIAGFRSKGISAFPYSLWLGISAMAGAILGAYIAVEISGQVFNRILAFVMLGVVILTVANPFKSHETGMERMQLKHRATGIALFFLVGIYGGFIQAGVGFLIIAVLTLVNQFSLVKTNSAKVFVILLYTLTALAVFIIEDKVQWEWGLVLAVGNSTGGWLGSRWQVKKGDKWIKRFLLVTVSAMAIKLWFFGA